MMCDFFRVCEFPHHEQKSFINLQLQEGFYRVVNFVILNNNNIEEIIIKNRIY